MPPRFTKFHGLGNDYLVIESEQLAGIIDLPALARRICDRHYGAGGDGIAIVSRSQTDDADFNVRIFNPDGSEAGMSGNGTRCAVAYLYYNQLWTADELRLNTKTGLKRYFPRERLGMGKFVFESELGQPQFDTDSIPMRTEQPMDRVVGYPLKVGGQTVQITALLFGNPHCCIFVDDFDAIEWRRLGRNIENHAQFPDRVNVTFVRVVNNNTLELRIWERGVGETSASGTCSCAAAIASMVNEKVAREIKAVMPGGEVKIKWRDDGEVVITGTAEVVYTADWLA
ncbi:MAG: diaminopimelate epimerase [Blastocatellia bacterium]|nr:MAG: diaminopimelate epimerase [Blastocatellia bacterium]